MAREVGIIISAKQTVSNVTNQAASAFGKLRTAANGAAGRVANLARAMLPLAANAARAASVIGVKLAGGLMRLAGAGIGRLFGMLGQLPNLFNAVSEAMSDSGSAASGAGSDYADAGKEADTAAADFDNAATTTEKAAKKAKIAFGAFGDVGAGFVMKAGSVTQQADDTAQAAVASAEAAGGAMADVESSVGGAEDSLSSFGQATERLGTAWTKVKNILLQAIGKALLPLIEKLADMLEDPRFIEFVTLLAEDLAKALGSVVDWIIKKVIPAVINFLAEVNKAGGPVAYVEKIFLAMVGKLKNWMEDLASEWNTIWEKIKNFTRNAIDALKGLFRPLIDLWIWEVNLIVTAFDGVWTALKTGAETAFTGLGTFVAGIATSVGNSFVGMVNGVIKALNGLIRAYNFIATTLGFEPLAEIENLQSFAKGGIVSAPMLAMVGDTPNGSPEVIAPLDKLAEMLRGTGLGMGGITVNVYGATGDNAFTLGREAGMGIANELRRAGVRLQTI